MRLILTMFISGDERERLEAEQIRDSLLFVSGELDGSHSNVSDFQTGIKNQEKVKKYSRNKARSIYIPSLRDNKIELLDIFDRPDNSCLMLREVLLQYLHRLYS